MNLILLGPPGAGKGTQGAMLGDRMGLTKIATGDLLRAAVKTETDLGIQAKSYMDQGLLVPDDIVLGLIEEVLASPGAQRGIIMDGFPRTVGQAEAVGQSLIERGSKVDCVLSITVPRDELIKRMLGRAEEQGRSDDTQEAIERRLVVYEEETAPLIAHYEEKGILAEVDGVGTVEEIASRIDQALEP
jgi:adenylate kinase